MHLWAPAGNAVLLSAPYIPRSNSKTPLTSQTHKLEGSSSQLPTTAEHVVIKSLCTVQITKQCSAAVGSWEEPLNIWLTVAKIAFVGLSFELASACFWRIRVLSPSPVSNEAQSGQTICAKLHVINYFIILVSFWQLTSHFFHNDSERRLFLSLSFTCL